MACPVVWTGGAAPGIRGDADVAHWRWYYTPDIITGPHKPVSYLNWGQGEPNYSTSDEYVIVLREQTGYMMNDASDTLPQFNTCFMCQCQ